ncbi:hypothetical protein AHAS_Ahas13G0149900 [Arachis hypogaea]
MLLFGTTLFSDKFEITVHWKYLLPLLSEFFQINKFSWGFLYLTHIYRSLCQTSRCDYKDMDDPLTIIITITIIIIIIIIIIISSSSSIIIITVVV